MTPRPRFRKRRGRHVRIAGAVLAACAFCAGEAALASGSTLPKPKQSKALEKAFARDHSHPRDAQIVNMRTSTVNHRWSLVRWTVPPHKAASGRSWVSDSAKARPKIIVYDSTYVGSPPKPAKSKPPRKVKKDLHRGLWLRITYTGNGQENGNGKYSMPMSCGGPEGTATWTEGLQGTFSWTRTVEVDLDSPSDLEFKNGEIVAGDFTTIQTDPTLGSGHDAWTENYTDSSGCTAPDHSTWTWTYKALKVPIDILFDQRGALISSPLYCASASPSPNASCANSTSRWSDVYHNLTVGVPLNVGLGGIGSTSTGPWNVSFPRWVPNADGSETSTTKGLCDVLAQWDSCADTLNWSGQVKVDVFNSGS